MVALALRSALSDRAAEGKVMVVEGWNFPAPRTRDAKAALATLGLTGRILVVLDREQEAAAKSFRNLPKVHLILPSELNAYDVLCSDWVVFTRDNLPGGADVHPEPKRPDTTHAAEAEAEAPEDEAPATGAPEAEAPEEDAPQAEEDRA